MSGFYSELRLLLKPPNNSQRHTVLLAKRQRSTSVQFRVSPFRRGGGHRAVGRGDPLQPQGAAMFNVPRPFRARSSSPRPKPQLTLELLESRDCPAGPFMGNTTSD